MYWRVKQLNLASGLSIFSSRASKLAPIFSDQAGPHSWGRQHLYSMPGDAIRSARHQGAKQCPQQMVEHPLPPQANEQTNWPMSGEQQIEQTAYTDPRTAPTSASTCSPEPHTELTYGSNAKERWKTKKKKVCAAFGQVVRGMITADWADCLHGPKDGPNLSLNLLSRASHRTYIREQR